MLYRLRIIAVCIYLALPVVTQAQLPHGRADAIRAEATRPNFSDVGRPLPLAASWKVTGMYNEAFTPACQQQLLTQGHHLLPWIEYPPTDRDLNHIFKPADPQRQKYIDARRKHFETTIKQLAKNKLPISFLVTQWESLLKYDKAYTDLPVEENLNVVGLDSKIKGQVCPFGPVETWREVGSSWTDSSLMKMIQQWYPDPPPILCISNNQYAKQQWTEAEQSKRYLDKYGPGKSNEFKRCVIGDGWLER